MTPAELVSLSLKQLAPAHLERLAVDISPGLAALGTLPLPCTTLGMVLQRLIQNAAEAAAVAGRARAHLHIEAEVLAAFSDSNKSRCILPEQINPLEYFFEMVAALQTAEATGGLSARGCR